MNSKTFVKLTEHGVSRVLDGRPGMVFPVENFTEGQAGPVAHVRDIRKTTHSIWSLGFDDYEKASNLETFLSLYKENLRKVRDYNPDMYAWDVNQLDEVFLRMKKAIIQGTYNKDSQSFRMTCKALDIKHTYKAINDFITDGKNERSGQ